MKGLKIFNLGRSRLAGITLACMGMLLGNVAYCGNLVATSPEFKLSLQDDGIRLSEGSEPLSYSSLWDGDENATVTIERDGVVIAENLTGSGDKEWRVTESGTYKLTHTTYTNGIASKVETATFVVSDQVATSPEFKLSLRDDGIRQSTGVETLTFGSLWDGDENATVTIEQDGVVIAENLTGEGDKEWRVTEDGTYKLTHTTYTNGVVSKVETATFVVSDQVATSPEFKLSLQDDGIRLSEGSEPLSYSSLWDGDENATVTIEQDGVVIAENLTGEGDKEWRVTEDGTYKLTHTTYTNGVVSKVETATFVVAGLSVEFPDGDVSIDGYTGKYDGLSHGITASVSDKIDGAVIKYSTSENGEFSLEMPTLTDVGTKTIWCEISAPGYITKTNSATINIAKRAVTLTSASDSKVYDGTALKAESVTVGDDGFANGEGATYTFTGSQTNVGTSDNSFTYTLNGNTKASNYDVTTANGKLTVTAADILSDAVITLGANPKYNGKEQEIAVSSVTYKGLPVTYTASGNKATDAGSYTLTITANGNFAGSKTAKWSIAKREVVLTSASDSKVYDGTALKAESVTVGGDGFADGEGATYTFTGSQTNVGTSENGFTYTLNNNTKAGNYDVTTANGKLTVTAADISADAVITLGANPKYNGVEQEIAVSSVTYKGLPVTFSASGNKATDAGSYTLTITANGNFVGSKTAKWSIGKRAVTLTSASDSKVYDGTALKVESVMVGGDGFANGEGATYTFTGSQTNVGTSDNSFTYTLNNNTKAGNYDVTTANGTLTVTKAKYPGQESGGTGIAWNVAMDAATWMYDGAEHGVALTGVPSGVTAKLTGNSAVDAGTYTASVVLEYDELNYEAPVAPQPIEWSITRRPITLMAASKDKPYDGFPLEVKGSDITASGSGYAPGECFEYYNMASITEVGEIAATFSYRDSSTAKVSNYDVTVVGGQTLKVTVGGDQISVTADSAIWAYDGTEHSLKSWKVINGDKLLSGHELQGKISDDSVITTPSDGDNGIVSNRFEYVKIVDRATGADRTRNYNLFIYEGSLQVTNATIHAEQLSGITDISKIYDGIASKVAVGAELLQPATIKYSLGENEDWSDASPEFVNAGNYTVGFTVDADYYHSYTGTLNVAIAKRPLKFTSPTKAKPYDGTALTFDGSEIEVEGVIDGEGFIFSNFASITDSGRIDSTFDYEAKEGTLASNYDIAINNGSLTIRASADEIAVTANDATWVYDGTEHSSHTYTVENGNKLQPGDELVVTFSEDSVITTPEDGHLGNGIVSNIITSVKVVRNGTTDVSSNYTLVWYPGMLSVTKAKMVVDGSNFSREFTYDGEGHTITVAPPTLLTSPVTVSYGISSDAITSEAAPLFRDAGTYTVYYSIAAKYYEPYTGSAVVTIKPRPVTLISSAAEKVYDGSPLKKDEVLVKDGSLGFVNGEGYTATCTGALTDVGGMENLFDYTFINGTKSDNYIITKEYGWLRITPATLDASVVFGGDILTCKRVFNGMAQKVQLSPVFSEAYKLTWALVSGDESAYGDAAPTLTNVSQGELDVFFKFVSPNYKPYYGKVVFSITPKTLTADNVTLVTQASDCLYDGTEKKPTFTLTDGSPSIITADDISVAYNNNVDAGVAMAKFTGKGNYTGIVSKDWNIAKRAVMLTSASDSKVYDGTALKGESVTVGGDGFANGEGATYTFTGSQTDVGTSDNSFTYTLNGNTKASNYDVTTANGTLTVTAADISADAVITLGANPKYSGVEQEIAVSSVTYKGLPVTFTASGNKATDAGSYTLTITATGNFAGTKTADWSIAKRTVTLTSATETKVYDGTALKAESVTVSGNGFADGEGATYTFTGSQTDVGTSENGFTYTLNGNTKAGNYDITTANGTLTVTAADISADAVITLGANPKYSGVEQEIAVNSVTYKGLPVTYTASGNNATDAGSYTLTITANGNFAGSKTAKWSIAKREVVLTSASDSKVYDGTALKAESVTVGGDGFADGEGATYTFTGSQTNVGTSENGFTYTLNGNTKAGNYDVTTANGILTVTAAGLGGDEEPGLGTIPSGGISKFDTTVMYDSLGHTVDTNAIVAAFKTAMSNSEIVLEFADTFGTGNGGLGEPKLPWHGVIPMVTNVGERIIWYRVSAANFEPFTHAAIISVTNRPVTVSVTGKTASHTYDGTSKSVEGYDIESEDLLYDIAKSTVFTGLSKVSRTDAGKTTMGLTKANFVNNDSNFAVTYNVTDGWVEIAAADISADAVITLGANPKYNGKEQEIAVSSVTYKGLPVTFSAFGNKATDAGSYTLTITATGNFAGTKTADWSIGKRVVTLTSATETKVYDGTALKGESVTVGGDGFTNGEGATYTFTGSQTDVGTSENGFTYTLNNNTKAGNYDVTTANGTLTVTTSAATDGSKWAVTLEGDNAKYDGTEKTVTVSALSYDGVAIPNYTITGNKATDAGNYTLTITANGNFVGSKSVEWSIAKRAVTLTSASDSKVYDGTVLKAESVTVSGDGFADGEGATYTFTGSQTDVGTSENSFTYTLNNNTKAGNYNITTANGKLTVTTSAAIDGSKWAVTLEGDNAKYDGTEKTVVISALSYDGFAITNYTISGNKATDAGTYTLTITATGNFTGTKTADWSIAKRSVTLTSASDSKVYDGTALKAESVTVGGDGFANGEGATYTFTGSQTNVGTSDNSFTYTLNGNTKAGNYDVTTANGTLTVVLPPTVELKIDLSKTEKGKGAWGNVKLFTNSIPLKVAVAGSITTYTINGGANVDLAFVPNEGFRIYGTQAGNGPFTSTTNYTFVAMTNSTYSATFQPAPKTGFAWKYAKNKNGWFCAQIAFPGFEGYAEAFENPRFLFADRVNSQNVRTSYLVDPSTVIDPLGTTEVYGNTTYRKVALPVSAFAGKVNGARVVFGVSDATMASSVDSVPAAERIMALRVVNRNINSVELLDNVIGYFAWDCCGETFYQPLGGKQSPGVILTKLLSIRTLNNAAAFGIDASAVAPEYVNCRFTSFNIANGKFVGTFEVVAESDEGTKAAVQEITSSVSTLLLGSESPAGPFEPIGDEVKDLTFDVDNAPFTFQGTLPQKYKFFRLNLNIEELYK